MEILPLLCDQYGTGPEMGLAVHTTRDFNGQEFEWSRRRY